MPLPKVAVALPSLLLLVLPARAEIIERIVAKINGDIITLSEFEARQAAAVQSARVEPDRIGAFLRENNARILQDAIDEMLLVQRAADVGLRLRPEYINEVIEGIKKENNIASDAELEEQLRREGMSLDDLKRSIERSVLRRQILSRELEPRLTVTDADAEEEYETRRAEYTVPAAVRLQEILVEGDGALARARDLVTRARGGEDFAGLAKAHSAAATRSSGGELGWVVRGEMSPVIEKIAGGLAPGQVSDPLPTGDGYRVLKVLEKRERRETPFEEVKDDIKQKLAEQRTNKEYAAYLEQLRKDAIIDIRVREVPLEVSTPTTGTLLEPLAAEPRPAGGDTEAEFVTSPQAAPERVARPPPPPPPMPRRRTRARRAPAARPPEVAPPGPRFFEQVYEIVRGIPRGRVATYGQVARLAGKARGARAVGWALRALREAAEPRIPWHRVVGAGGRISPRAGPGPALQERRLLEEGVAVRGGRIDLARHGIRGGTAGPGSSLRAR